MKSHPQPSVVPSDFEAHSRLVNCNPEQTNRCIYPGTSNLSGFKKRLFFRVRALNGRLMPALNRRKHSHSHHMILENQVKNFSKTFSYVKKKTLSFWAAEALSESYGPGVRSPLALLLPPLEEGRKTGNTNKPMRLKNRFSVAHLTSTAETQQKSLFWRHGFCYSLNYPVLTTLKLHSRPSLLRVLRQQTHLNIFTK